MKDKHYLAFIPVVIFAISTTTYTNYKMNKMREIQEKNLKERYKKYLPEYFFC